METDSGNTICSDDPIPSPVYCLNVAELAYKLSLSFIYLEVMYIFINYEPDNLHAIFTDGSVIASLIFLPAFCLVICCLAIKAYKILLEDDTQPSSLV